MSRRQALIETALVFLVFFIQGAWPVPEVNEPYYLGKAIHFWNPEWASGDLFLQTADTHAVFYFTFGWLSRWLPELPLAWTLRLLTWGLLAWAWRRLSFAVVPQRWFAPLTAAWFVFLLQHFNMAGEWVVGGVEAKGFAYVLVLLALESLVRGHWNRTWLLLGAASAFHVLVGGWSAVAVGMVWLVEQASRLFRRGPTPTSECRSSETAAQQRTSGTLILRSMLPGLIGGLALAMFGLAPSLRLDWGADPAIVRRAHEIYVFERLPHHLNPWQFAWKAIWPFVLLCVAWFAMWRVASADEGRRRLRSFVNACLVIALAGVAVGFLQKSDRGLAAGLLRFYWFRLSDVAVPLGVAIFSGAAVQTWGKFPTCQAAAGKAPAPRLASWKLAPLCLVAVFHLADCVVLRLFSAPPHAERLPDLVQRLFVAPAEAERMRDLEAWRTAGKWLLHPDLAAIFPRRPRADRLAEYLAWRKACEWVAESGEVPADARFLVPRGAQTFRWYAQRGEVANLKELPQDAVGLVAWWDRMKDIYATGLPPPDAWHHCLEELGAERLRVLGAKYGADYAITTRLQPWDEEQQTRGPVQPPLPLPVAYISDSYIIYRLR